MQDPTYVRSAFDRIAPCYDHTNRILSGGIDLIWRKRVVDLVVAQRPKKVLDLASGTGDLALAYQKRMPDTEIIAADLTPAMLKIAQKRGVLRTREVDALAMPFADHEFDVVTCAFGLRNMADYLKALQEMQRVLRPGGLLLILDFSTPPAPLNQFYQVYLEKILPCVAGVLTKHKDAYQYLAKSIGDFPSGTELCTLLQQAGFEAPSSWELSLGIASIYTGRASAH